MQIKLRILTVLKAEEGWPWSPPQYILAPMFVHAERGLFHDLKGGLIYLYMLISHMRKD